MRKALPPDFQLQKIGRACTPLSHPTQAFGEVIFNFFSAFAEPHGIPVIRDDAPAAPALGGQFLSAQIPQDILPVKIRHKRKITLIRAHRKGVRRLKAAVFRRAELQPRAQNAQAAKIE